MTTSAPSERNAPGERPWWVDDELFPFESKFVKVGGHTIHHVDEGEGPLLLMHHGNPTWSFLYRDLIKGLKGQFRCVAYDLPGFGLSTAAPGFDFSPAAHADVSESFIRELDLTQITPFVQDWGGPIGLACAVRMPERYDRLIIGNTWGWRMDSVGAKVFSNVLGGPLGREAILRFNTFAKKIVPMGHRRRTLTENELAHYTNPFPTRESRIPTAVFPRAITQSDALLAEVEAGLAKFRDTRALLVWALQDMAFRKPELERWQSELPHQTTRLLQGTGHYLQDDAPDLVIDAIRDWWTA